MFSVHATGKPEKYENTTIVLDLFLKKFQTERDHMIILMQSFSKSSVFKMFSVLTKTRSLFSNSSDLKSILKKFHFCDRLVWMAGLTEEIKLLFQISQAYMYCGQGHIFSLAIKSLFFWTLVLIETCTSWFFGYRNGC